jgi:ketosteroid isomerase-like protein
MSHANVELLRGAFDKFVAGNSDFGAELVDPEVVWDASEMDLVDSGGFHRGPEGVQEFWRNWLAAWESIEFEYELVEAGDSVVALIDQRMRGRSSGIEVAFGKYAQVYTFRDGLIVHWKVYANQSEALEAVGLRE